MSPGSTKGRSYKTLGQLWLLGAIVWLTGSASHSECSYKELSGLEGMSRIIWLQPSHGQGHDGSKTHAAKS